MSAAKEESATISNQPLDDQPVDDGNLPADELEKKIDGKRKDLNELVFDGVFDDLRMDDIYSDLKVDSLNDMNYTELRERYDQSQVELEELRKENGSLKRENEILKKNITSLYLTARSEVQRKDREIKTLNDRAMRHRINANQRRMGGHFMFDRSQNQTGYNRNQEYEVGRSDFRFNDSYQSFKRKRDYNNQSPQMHHRNEFIYNDNGNNQHVNQMPFYHKQKLLLF